MVFDYKLSFRSCTDEDKWKCASGDCGSESVELNIVDEEDREWCQREGVMTREVSSNSLFQLRSVTRQLKQQIQQNATDLIAFTQCSNLYISLDKNIVHCRSVTHNKNYRVLTTTVPFGSKNLKCMFFLL